MKVFVMGPFSAALARTDTGELIWTDSRLRTAFDVAFDAVRKSGAEILSAHLSEGWGAEVDVRTLAGRDLTWLVEADACVVLLPLGPDGLPYRTDGTFVELGCLLAAGKPNVVVVERLSDDVGWSYFLRSLAVDRINVVEWDAFTRNAEQIVRDLVRGPQQSGGCRTFSDPETALALLRRREHVRTTSILGVDVLVHPGVFSPEVSHSGEWLIRNWGIEPGERVLDLGCGTGVLGLFAALGGASEVWCLDVNPAAVENARANFAQHGVSQRFRGAVSDAFDSVGGERFDVVVVSPPYWNRPAPDLLSKACFDEGYSFLDMAMRQARSHLTPTGRVYVAFSSQGDMRRLLRRAAEGGLRLTSIAPMRPLSVSDHIRYAMEFEPL